MRPCLSSCRRLRIHRLKRRVGRADVVLLQCFSVTTTLSLATGLRVGRYSSTSEDQVSAASTFSSVRSGFKIRESAFQFYTMWNCRRDCLNLEMFRRVIIRLRFASDQARRRNTPKAQLITFPYPSVKYRPSASPSPASTLRNDRSSITQMKSMRQSPQTPVFTSRLPLTCQHHCKSHHFHRTAMQASPMSLVNTSKR